MSAVKRRKKGGVQVYLRIIEKEIYQTFEVILNSTSVFCREEGWQEADGLGLQILK